MQTFKKLYCQHFLLTLILFFTNSIAQQCGNIELQAPFLSHQNSTNSSPLKSMIKCKSQKLYLRTTLGLFPISAIDYTSKTLTISHTNCSSSHQYISPSLLSAGFPSPPHPNSLLLFNCSNKAHNMPSLIRNCTRLHACGAASDSEVPSSSCLLVQDIEKLDTDFHPNDLSCSSYRRVYRRSLGEEEEYEGVELGTRISFDVPDHVPDICNECNKPNGNCGVGLRCICHARECKDKVVSSSRQLSTGISFLYQLCSIIVLMNFWMI